MQHAAPPGLLGIRRRLLDLRVQRQSRRQGVNRFRSNLPRSPPCHSGREPGGWFRVVILFGVLLAAAPPARALEARDARQSPACGGRQAVRRDLGLLSSKPRIDSYQVYVWSRMVLDCRREMAAKAADRVAALDEHLTRMKKLEALITRVRTLGFGRSYDVGAAEYYRLEAEHWLELERRGSKPGGNRGASWLHECGRRRGGYRQGAVLHFPGDLRGDWRSGDDCVQGGDLSDGKIREGGVSSWREERYPGERIAGRAVGR